MGIKAQRRRNRFLDSLDFSGVDGEGLILVLAIGALAAIFMLPSTIFRLSRLAWKIDDVEGMSRRHRRIVGMLIWYGIFWTIALYALVSGAVFVIDTEIYK